MTLRCKKCFKKYPSHYPQCPHCGKINNTEEDRTKKSFDFLWFMPQKQCEVCGTDKKFTSQFCPNCRSMFDDNKKHQSDISNYEKESVSNYIKNLYQKETLVDFKAFSSFAKENNYLLDKWQFSGNEKYGNYSNVKLTMILTSIITSVPFLSVLDGSNGPAGFFWYIILLGFVNYITYITRHMNYDDWLLFERINHQKNGKISLNTKTRGEREKYAILDNDLEKITIIINPNDNTIEQVRFIAKNEAITNAPIYIVDTKEYGNMEKFKLFIVLFCHKYSIKLTTMHNKDQSNGPQSGETDKHTQVPTSKLFMRLDIKIQDMAVPQEDFQAHIEYLTLMANSHYLKGGGFVNEPGGMIIFESRDIEEARSISDRDPIIKKGYYRYELKEWQIALDSEKI